MEPSDLDVYVKILYAVMTPLVTYALLLLVIYYFFKDYMRNEDVVFWQTMMAIGAIMISIAALGALGSTFYAFVASLVTVGVTAIATGMSVAFYHIINKK